ncbi:MAG: carbamoyltransferase C-terminal domain-containing protein [Bacteroidota bacterium]
MSSYHLGINLGHNRSAAIVKDGKIVVAINEERLDKVKHSVGFLHDSVGNPRKVQIPHQAIAYCLNHLDITTEDLSSITGNMPGVDYSKEIIGKNYPAKFSRKILEIPSHHLAHAYSAFWPSGFDESVILIADASGTTDSKFMTESYSIYKGSGTQIDLLHGEKVRSYLAPISTLGFLYEYITKKAGFTSKVSNQIEVPEAGKLMGLAPYGNHQKNWLSWIETHDDDFSLDFSAYDIVLEIEALVKRYDNEQGKPYMRSYLVDLANKVQNELEKALLHISKLALKETGMNKICLAGGVALNSVANYKLFKQLALDDIFIFPASGDDGIAAGCALWAYAKSEAEPKRKKITSASLGTAYSDKHVEKGLEQFNNDISWEKLTKDEMIKRCGSALSLGNIVARFEGGTEYGPRALGNRSILADPTFAKMRDIINARVKFRESFRPFAPVVPEDMVDEIFDQDTSSPFMLMVANIRKEFHDLIPSVTHVDGTGRVQTVNAKDNTFFYNLCHTITDLRYGPAVILNTSFNVAGQPIVETAEDAIETFLRTDIDYLSLGDYWISKNDVPVLNYNEHLKKVANDELPVGLPPNQPSVLEEMKALDNALFNHKVYDTPWNIEELKAISSRIAIFKESSRRFKEDLLGKEFDGRLKDDLLLMLDPLGMSKLVDIGTGKVQGQYTYSEVLVLLAVKNGETNYAKIKAFANLTDSEMKRKIDWACKELSAFGMATDIAHCTEIKIDQLLANEITDSIISTKASKLFEPFVDEDFSIVQVLQEFRFTLKTHKYNEESICQKLTIDSLQQIQPTYLHYYNQYKLENQPLDNLIRLFLLRGKVDQEAMSNLFSDHVMEALHLIGVISEDEGLWQSSVDVYCVSDLFITTDHRFLIKKDDRMNESPVMYIGMDSKGLAHTAPRSKQNSVLDLCSGSGIQAIVASRYAEEVTGVDINPRAIRFARFNAQLNGVFNARFKLGNLYDAVASKKFDIVLANPPFVPSPEESLRFRDGGANGEKILKAIIKQAPKHLNPKGKLYIVSDLVDVNAYEDKITSWLKGVSVDALILKTADRNEILFTVPHSHAPFGQSFEDYNQEVDRWITNFRKAGLSSVNFGYILVQFKSKSEKSSYYIKTIHNPNKDIYHDVEEYFETREMLSTRAKSEFRLNIARDITFRCDTSTNGALKHKILSDTDPYFTIYEVSKEIFEGLKFISTNKPFLYDFNSTTNHWIYDLIHKGIVKLSLVGESRAQMVEQNKVWMMSKQTGPDANGSIEELETKTTPTCLSSYLRQ